MSKLTDIIPNLKDLYDEGPKKIDGAVLLDIITKLTQEVIDLRNELEILKEDKLKDRRYKNALFSSFMKN
jgi:hypothetical protein